MNRELHWNIRRADLALEHLPLLAADQQRVVRGAMQGWSEIDWRTLRHGVIHGDANDHNVLVREGASWASSISAIWCIRPSPVTWRSR